MRKNFGAKPISFPQPVLMIATYNDDGTPNIMNAAWGGLSGRHEITICLGSHRTTDNILSRKAFTVSMATVSQTVPCDYVGVVSGNDVPDKFSRAGFHALASELVDAPMVMELPMCLECRLISYDPANGHVVGDIVNVSADESVLGEDDLVDLKKLNPITFDTMHKTYLALGETVGNAFRDGLTIR